MKYSDEPSFTQFSFNINEIFLTSLGIMFYLQHHDQFKLTPEFKNLYTFNNRILITHKQDAKITKPKLVTTYKVMIFVKRHFSDFLIYYHQLDNAHSIHWLVDNDVEHLLNNMISYLSKYLN